MVKLLDAAVAYRAVLGPRGAVDVAGAAPLVLHPVFHFEKLPRHGTLWVFVFRDYPWVRRRCRYQGVHQEDPEQNRDDRTHDI